MPETITFGFNFDTDVVCLWFQERAAAYELVFESYMQDLYTFQVSLETSFNSLVDDLMVTGVEEMTQHSITFNDSTDFIWGNFTINGMHLEQIGMEKPEPMQTIWTVEEVEGITGMVVGEIADVMDLNAKVQSSSDNIFYVAGGLAAVAALAGGVYAMNKRAVAKKPITDSFLTI